MYAIRSYYAHSYGASFSGVGFDGARSFETKIDATAKPIPSRVMSAIGR